MALKYEIKRSGRKTLAIEITRELKILVRSPYYVPPAQIEAFVKSHEDWIEAHLAKMAAKVAAREDESEPPFTEVELRQLGAEALRDIPPRVAYYAEKLGVKYGRITVRNQKSRWGSCSAAGNLNFNYLLMLCPAEVRDYVVIHELCHRKEMNHSAVFWALVTGVCPDYKEKRNWLKNEGEKLIRRL